MSALAARSALVLQLAQLDATKCADCEHALADHLPSYTGIGRVCKEWHWKYENGKATKQVECKCKRWVDPSEQLPIGGDK